MRAEQDTNGLNPGEVSSLLAPLANKMSIDMNVEIRDQAKFLVFLAMKVKHDAITPNEPWVLTKQLLAYYMQPRKKLYYTFLVHIFSNK